VPQQTEDKKICPDAGISSRAVDGIDAYWRSKHEDIMPYQDAWPLLKSGKYKPVNPGKFK